MRIRDAVYNHTTEAGEDGPTVEFPNLSLIFSKGWPSKIGKLACIQGRM